MQFAKAAVSAKAQIYVSCPANVKASAEVSHVDINQTAALMMNCDKISVLGDRTVLKIV